MAVEDGADGRGRSGDVHQDGRDEPAADASHVEPDEQEKGDMEVVGVRQGQENGDGHGGRHARQGAEDNADGHAGDRHDEVDKAEIDHDPFLLTAGLSGKPGRKDTRRRSKRPLI
ncbi:hypothetical protein SDC9_128626 [bioreactor metagenome]|uniref:Uncharacterized protein n=1 Tax=bioreactor metagenome TaxID=1076179 RepID=A0A645CY03_9ZZZZ